MPTDERLPAREQTDESLRVERERSDEAVNDRRNAIDATADTVIETARRRADEVLAAARRTTDRSRAALPADRCDANLLERERAKADQALVDERTEADETLRVERAERVALLSAERDATDADLSSERARADDALAKRDEFLGIVSHDLRTMLSAVMGNAWIIAEAARGGQSQKIIDRAQRIQHSGARMSRLIGDLLDVASIEAGRLNVTREKADARQLVVEAVDTFQPQALASELALSMEIEEQCIGFFDPARVLQVLVNLVSNAMKFTAPGGTIVVRAEAAEHELRFAIHDSGRGIPEDKLGAIFERFVQVDKNDRRGVGLGLFISQCIVEGHGGRIWAESTVGKGSTFHFTLPQAGTIHSSSSPG